MRDRERGIEVMAIISHHKHSLLTLVMCHNTVASGCMLSGLTFLTASPSLSQLYSSVSTWNCASNPLAKVRRPLSSMAAYRSNPAPLFDRRKEMKQKGQRVRRWIKSKKQRRHPVENNSREAEQSALFCV